MSKQILRIPDSVMEYAPWSHTKASCALSCPYKFHLQYRVKQKGVGPEAFGQRIGKLVHMILEWVSGRGMSVSHAYTHLVSIVELTHEEETEIQCFRDAIEDYVRGLEVFRKKHGVHKSQVKAEVHLGMRPDFTPTKSKWDKKGFYVGYIDLMLMTPERVGIAIDHKTGVVMSTDTYRAQLESYAVLLQSHHPRINAVQVAVHHVGADSNERGTRTTWFPSFSAREIRTTLRANLIDYLTKAAENVKDRDPCKGWVCAFCDYKPTCPLFG